MNMKRWAVPAMALLMLSLAVPRSWAGSGGHDARGSGSPPGGVGGGGGAGGGAGGGGSGGANGSGTNAPNIWRNMIFRAVGKVVLVHYLSGRVEPLSGATVIVQAATYSDQHAPPPSSATSHPDFLVPDAMAVAPGNATSTVVFAYAEIVRNGVPVRGPEVDRSLSMSWPLNGDIQTVDFNTLQILENSR